MVGSVQVLTGEGVAPMRKVYSRLSAEERVRIDELRNREGLGVRQIALRIGRDKWIGYNILDSPMRDE